MVGALATGCTTSGTPTVEEYGRSLGSARDRVDFALERITQAGSRDELLERMDEAAATIDDAASDLGGVGAPRKVESETGVLVDALRQLAFDLRATADQIRQPGFGDLVIGTRGLSFESWDAVNLALRALRTKGIDVAPLERH